MFTQPSSSQKSSIHPSSILPRVDASAITFDAPAKSVPDTFWTTFGMADGERLGEYRLSSDVIAFGAEGEVRRSALSKFLMALETPPKFSTKDGERQQTFFRLAEPRLAETLRRSVPDGIDLIAPAR